MEGFYNKRGKLTFHRQSLKGAVQDYDITFNDNVASVEEVIDDAYELFEKLMEKFKDKNIKVRLIAKVDFVSVRDGKEAETRSFYFTSFQAENVYDPEEFFNRHMLKIASRLKDFNRNGSNLIIKTISDCYVAITVL